MKEHEIGVTARVPYKHNHKSKKYGGKGKAPRYRNDLPSPEELKIVCPHPERKRRIRGLCKTCHRRWFNYASSEARLSHNRSSVLSRDKVRTNDPNYYKLKNKTYALRKRYGLTLEQYDSMIVAQKGSCFICGVVPLKSLSVDHCHATGRVRGLLCGKCNRGIAFWRDDVKVMEKAIEYLERQIDWRNYETSES